jgi:hypothetical protein
VTAALDEMARDPKAGPAETLRRAMLTLIDQGKPEEAHPAFWAPFVVVGEGATVSSDILQVFKDAGTRAR